MKFERRDWLHAAGTAAILFLIYAATAPRTVALEDDGGFILSSYFLGIEHPPGYPLHTLLGKLFTLLPMGSIAYRVHLVSALFGALTCAAVWLCARRLLAGTLAPYLAAYGLGLSKVFWSQAIIAEVYTLNTFFVLCLFLLGLRAAEHESGSRKALIWMAPVFGLSLANHWPLMLLVAPAFAILVWPCRSQLLRLAPVLCALFATSLVVPYAWMVVHSWSDPPISFAGPIESARELWAFVTRASYGGTDVSPSADWLDRLKYFRFLGAELLLLFAVLGSLLAVGGFVLQWRVWGRLLSASLTIAFVMPSAGLLLLLGFDYDAVHKHVYHVYPLPAYAVASLWMALGFERLMQRLALPARAAAALGALLVALIAAASAGGNLRANYDWSERYARAILESLPPDAILFVHGDAAVGAVGYFHLIEGLRPDVTLYSPKGIVFGNRLFHSMRTDQAGGWAAVREFISRQTRPVFLMGPAPPGVSTINRWLYAQVATPPAQGRESLELPPPMRSFADKDVLGKAQPDPWTNFVRGELKRSLGALLANGLAPNRPAPADTERYLALLSEDFLGALGIAQGLLTNPAGRSTDQVASYLALAGERMPADAAKKHVALYFELRGYVRLDRSDRDGAVRDMETSVALLPLGSNRAAAVLADMYTTSGNAQGLEQLRKQLARGGPSGSKATTQD